MMMLLALPQPARGASARRRRGRRGGLELEHGAERHAEQARAADPEEVAAGDPERAVAEVLARLTGDDDHRGTPSVRGSLASLDSRRVGIGHRLRIDGR